MLELISVVVLAAIGVAFTSYQGEQNGSPVSRRTARDDADEQAEPVGIFGYDVGRRLRDGMRFFGARSAEDQQTLDEAEALAARLSVSLGQDDEQAPSAAHAPEVPTDRLIEDTLRQQGWDRDLSESEVDAVLAAEPALTDDGFEAPLEEAWASSLGAVLEEGELAEEDEIDPPEAEPLALTRDDLLSEDPAPQPETATAAPVRTLNVPVIHDFDPKRDQIVLEYRPEEAGDGRVGVISDTHHPGAALVTLGGKVVAIIDGGEGQVTAAHVELIREGEQTSAA